MYDVATVLIDHDPGRLFCNPTSYIKSVENIAFFLKNVSSPTKNNICVLVNSMNNHSVDSPSYLFKTTLPVIQLKCVAPVIGWGAHSVCSP